MIKYDLLVYLGLVPVLAAFILATYIVRSTADNVDLEVRRIRVADGVLIALAALFVFAAILYFVDAGGAGKEIFDKSSTAILALVGTIIGYIFGSAKK
jgi:cytochrome bd-type quinol oxidase subunit 2